VQMPQDLKSLNECIMLCAINSRSQARQSHMCHDL